MRIFFDVDLTLLHSDSSGWTLRPNTREVFAQLKTLGHDIYLWTATGKAHAERVVQYFRLEIFVTDCMDKDSRNAVKPDFIVDDDSYLVEKYGGVFVTPYRVPDLLDKELQKVIAFLGQEIS